MCVQRQWRNTIFLTRVKCSLRFTRRQISFPRETCLRQIQVKKKTSTERYQMFKTAFWRTGLTGRERQLMTNAQVDQVSSSRPGMIEWVRHIIREDRRRTIDECEKKAIWQMAEEDVASLPW